LNFAEIFGIRKLQSLDYHVTLFAIPSLAVSVEHRLVTDRQTRDCCMYRASMASRNKSVKNVKRDKN